MRCLVGPRHRAVATKTCKGRGLIDNVIVITDKATSELVPPGEDEVLLSSLSLSDMIRSKGIEPEAALKSVRRRIGHKNPNVQVQALHVLDVLVKNSGNGFLLAVGNGKDGWLDQLEALCRTVSQILRGCTVLIHSSLTPLRAYSVEQRGPHGSHSQPPELGTRIQVEPYICSPFYSGPRLPTFKTAI